MARYGVCLIALLLVLAPAAAHSAQVTLNAVLFPEKRDVSLDFASTARAPRGSLRAKIVFREAQGNVRVQFSNLKPAILFGGNVTCYTLWAVTREGKTANLGELWVRDPGGSADYTTGFKEFALLVTAESHPLVDQPSELIIAYSQAAKKKNVRNTEFAFSDFAPAPEHDKSSIADVAYAGDTPLDLLQARKTLELAEGVGAEDYAPGLLGEARITLAQATNFAQASARRKEFLDYSRRTVALASEAIRTTNRKQEAERLAELIAKRRAEMAALEERAAEAEATAQEAEAQMQALRQERQELEESMQNLQEEKSRLEEETMVLEQEKQMLQAEKEILEEEKATLEAEKANLEAEKANLEARTVELQEEKQLLSERLQGALSQVASTQRTARGLIVNLPDILFDLNEATLKPEARLTLAKLAGILLIMPELNLRIEGHTDSTGTPSYNMRLSQRRADSVFDFLAEQGIASTRMKAAGYGQDRPVADNSTREGRAQNRRVEIVIAEGEVQEAG